MLLSVVMPIYKVEKYLRQCVDSFLNQNLTDYEIILVDDGSPDGCPAICDEYATRYPEIIRVIHKENAGQSVARNVGMDMAQGEYILFADSDDYVKGDALPRAIALMQKEQLDVLHNNFWQCIEDGEPEDMEPSPLKQNTVLTHKDVEEMLCHLGSYGFTTFAWRDLYRLAFLRENGICFNENMRRIEDPPFNMEAFAKAKRMMVVNDPWYVYRLRRDSLQRSKYIEHYEEDYAKQWVAKRKIYEENCTPQKAFYEDQGQQMIVQFLPIMLANLYHSHERHKLALLRHIGNTPMFRTSFKEYDIRGYKSRSVDWIVADMIRRRCYLVAHLLCVYVLYK